MRVRARVYVELDEVIASDVVHRAEDNNIISANLKLSADLWQRIAKAVKEREK